MWSSRVRIESRRRERRFAGVEIRKIAVRAELADAAVRSQLRREFVVAAMDHFPYAHMCTAACEHAIKSEADFIATVPM